MSEALKILQFLRDLHINPLGAVIAIAVIAAWLEQTFVRRTAPNFTSAHRGVGATLRPGRPRS